MGLAGAVHADIVLSVLAGHATHSELAASWRRSGHVYALDPAGRSPSYRLPQAEIARVQEHLGRIIEVAHGTLDRLFLALASVGCSVLLADSTGVVVDRRGASGDDSTFEAWGLWTGAVWSEKFEGTNGIGTCIAERRPLTVDRDQHFLTRNSVLFCTTAPIFDEHGELVAVLDVSSCRADLTHGFSRLIATAVIDAARTIESDNFRSAFPNARILLAPKSDRAANSMLAVDDDDLVIGATRAARRSLRLDNTTLARRLPAADIIGEVHSKTNDMIAAQRSVIQRALARSHGKVSRAARDLNMSRATLHRKLKQLGIGH